MKYEPNSPAAHAVEQQKQRIKDLVAGVHEIARANGIDPTTNHSAAWAMARFKRPDLFQHR
jgi:hypothetical protein